MKNKKVDIEEMKAISDLIDSLKTVDEKCDTICKEQNIEEDSLEKAIVNSAMLVGKAIMIKHALNMCDYEIPEEIKHENFYKETLEIKCCGKTLITRENVAGCDHDYKCYLYVCPICKKEYYLYDYNEYGCQQERESQRERERERQG
jgi:hypothetical protein